ncbi:MAG: RNA methyltransferase [Deltaproteobacteria bacterium]|nr:RNA methyltransferase [Deltaproteobacteria bacterium]
MTLDPSQISVVLVETTQPGNIGSTARAMENMGVTDLRLVNPCEVDHPEARMFSMNARHLLYEAKIFPSLKEAVQDCQLIIATSNRQRDKIQTSNSVYDLPRIIQAFNPDISIAIVFGPEQSGLTNEDMSLCNEWIYIPTFGKTSSLNLAQAVMVLLYEASKLYHTQRVSEPDIIEPASSNSIEGMKEHFFRILETTGFLRLSSRNAIWGSFSGLIGRAKPDERDVRLLRGFFNRIEVTLKRKNK